MDRTSSRNYRSVLNCFQTNKVEKQNPTTTHQYFYLELKTHIVHYIVFNSIINYNTKNLVSILFRVAAHIEQGSESRLNRHQCCVDTQDQGRGNLTIIQQYSKFVKKFRFLRRRECPGNDIL